MQGKIGIIVVSYHNPEMTTRYVRQELPKLTTPYTLVVVNVASNLDESKQLADSCGLCLVEDNHPFDKSHRGYLIWDKENLGYARGNNKGVRFLIEHFKVDFFLFSNNDIEINSKDCISVLISRLNEDRRIGAIGPRIISLDGSYQLPHDTPITIYRQIGWMLFPFLRKKRKKTGDKEKKGIDIIPPSRFTYWVQGSFFVMRTKDFIDAGMFDPNTFLYAEEPIMAEKLKRIGKQMYFENSVEVLHYEGGTIVEKYGNKQSRRMVMESNCYYYKEYMHYKSWLVLTYKYLFLFTNRG